jgi:hypothetical protein
MRWPENDESLGQMAVAFQRSALRIHRRVSVRVSYGSSFRWRFLLASKAKRFTACLLINVFIGNLPLARNASSEGS